MTPQQNKGIEEAEWKVEFREYFDKTLKPKKPTMKNLDRELCVNFIQNVVNKELEGIKRDIEQIKEAVQSSTGSFKYDDCYDDCVRVIDKRLNNNEK